MPNLARQKSSHEWIMDVVQHSNSFPLDLGVTLVTTVTTTTVATATREYNMCKASISLCKSPR